MLVQLSGPGAALARWRLGTAEGLINFTRIIFKIMDCKGQIFVFVETQKLWSVIYEIMVSHFGE